MQRALLAASAVEAFFLLTLLGYGPLYLHQTFHASDVLASMAAAAPALAMFLGSTWWGHRLSRLGTRRVAFIGIAGYFAGGLVIFLAPGPWIYIIGLMGSTLLSSALAPATLTLLTVGGGDMGRRLAGRLQWQSSGWLLGGLVSGYAVSVAPRGFPDLEAALALLMVIPALLMARAPGSVHAAAPAEENMPGATGLTILLVLPFFLAYAGNEGFFTNFGLYLHALAMPTTWVGWSASISTALGWVMASSIGRWADRFGGKALLIRVLVAYTAMYLAMSLARSEIIVIVAFSVPLYPLLNIGIQRAVAESLPARLHGGAMGLINGASGLATTGGSLMMGTMSSFAGPYSMPWTAVSLVLAGLVLAQVLYRPSRRPRLSEP